MQIYGLGLLAFCMIVGSTIGVLLGKLAGVQGDVGGVGIAMFLFIFILQYMEKKKKPLSEEASKGISFLNAIYIPVVVAMSANQNVVSALSGGAVAILAGVISVVGGLLFIPLLTKLEKKISKGGDDQ
jgi:malonate transporter MadL subunit